MCAFPLACICDSLVAYLCSLQSVFVCDCAYLLSRTSHLMVPLNTANRKPEGRDKELACKGKIEENTHALLCFTCCFIGFK